jgi:3-oxoacyl-[acyl-carrier-protein] synthase II
MNRRVVVTGLGVVCGLGLDWSTVWSGLLNGRSAIRRWQLPGVERYPVQYAAPVDDDTFWQRFGHLEHLREPMERRVRFGLAAAWDALADAGLGDVPRLGTVGVAIGSGVPERSPDEMMLALTEEGSSWGAVFQHRARLSPDSGLLCGNDALTARIAERHKLGGPALNLSTACAGAAHAIGLGFRAIRRGEVEAMLVGGADSVLNLPTLTALHLLGAPSTTERFGDRLCRPFDRDRSGLVAAEGAGMVLLETLESARARGATIYAEVAGFGSSLDAYRITAPHPEGRGAVLAMQKALRDARIEPQAVACINAHGTSTLLNDSAETIAIKTVFAAENHYQRLAVTANKSALGHLIAAAGAPEFIATVLSVREGVIPPTLNLENPDPACDLDYVPNTARRQPIPVALSNSFGFGGLNAALVVNRYEN